MMISVYRSQGDSQPFSRAEVKASDTGRLKYFPGSLYMRRFLTYPPICKEHKGWISKG